MSNPYQATLDQARSELAALTEQRDRLNLRIAALSRSIEGLAALCGEGDFFVAQTQPSNARLITAPEIRTANAIEVGISDAIRNILAAAAWPVSVPEIRNALVSDGFDPNAYKNLLTVIHNTLRRLERQGEAHVVPLPFGGSGRWAATPRPEKKDIAGTLNAPSTATPTELLREAERLNPSRPDHPALSNAGSKLSLAEMKLEAERRDPRKRS